MLSGILYIIMQKFEELYTKLNPQQKKAVETIEGPVLVLAGPGTGKTQVLTLRIANILRQTQMNPYNILCLTFTESAAHEMRERLSSIIGTAAYDVEINTFHGFANSIIKEFPYTFNAMLSEEGESEFVDYQPLDDFSRFKIIENLLNQNNWQHLTPLKNNLVHLNQISKHLQDFKRERILPQNLQNSALEQEQLLKMQLDDPKITKTQQARVETELKMVKRSLELCKLYQLYNLELVHSARYDYEDMINWVVDALKSDPELALIYQEKYQYILVDEFQDSNNAQLELLRQLTSFEKTNPNLFVVGDPNQSIYRFQGASTINIDQFIKQYKNAKVIELNLNYRNSQKIIDASSSVIVNNSAPIKLVAKNKLPSKIELVNFLHKEQEIYEIAKKIKTLIKQKTNANEIAILVRKNDQLLDFITALSAQKIPFQVIKGDKVLTNPFIEKILLLAETIVDPSDKIKFSQLFYFYREYFTLKDADIIKKAIFKNTKMVGLSNNAKNFLQKLEDVAKKIAEIPLANALIEILNEFDILNKALLAKDRLEKLNLLKALHNNAKPETLSLGEWLQKLRAMQVYNLDLPSEPILYGEEDAVVISTVHQAKGKEYKAVFLPQMQQNVWSKTNRSIFYIPKINLDVDENEIQIQEERRLFYVGLTRAKTQLFLSSAKLDNDREIMPSRYLQELSPNIKAQSKSEDEEKTIQRIATQLAPIPQLSLSQLETAWLKNIVSKQPLSPTGFTTYTNCPRNYLIKNILRIPQVKSPSQAYGTAIHSALENYFALYQQMNHPPTLEELLGYYHHALDSELQLSQIEKKKYLSDGDNLLTEYYKLRAHDFQIPIETEFAFRNIYLDEIPLSGKVDKIEWLNVQQETVRVIDYKTGRAKTRNALLGFTQDKDTDYLYQLKFYQLLCELDHKFYIKWKIGESALEFLDSDSKFTRESFTFTHTEIDDLKKEIRTVWQNIQALKFDHNPNSKFGCEFCELLE